jgi:hypothetical protein
MTHDHDSLFHLTFSEPEHAASLLRTILPAALAHAIHWDSLRLEPGSFVDDALKTRHADLLFTARMGRQRVLLYVVLEHKSGADRWTALQLLRYVVRVFDRFLADNPEATSLPPVLPIVVHHGPRAWTAPRTVLDLVGLGSLPPSIRKVLSPLQPNLHFLLDDLAAQPESKLKRRRTTKPARLTLLFLQFVRGAKGRDPAEFVGRWLYLERPVWHDPAGRRLLRGLFSYLAAQLESPRERLEAAAALIHEDARIMGKTIADQFREEGELVGKRKLLLRQVRKRFGDVSPTVEERIRSADPDTLDRWAERILTATTIDELFV